MIGQEELVRIGDYVKSNLRTWLEETGLRPAPDLVTNTQLLERVVRVEEELKAQRDLMVVRFEALDTRFNLMQWLIVTAIALSGGIISLIAFLP